MKPRRKGGFSPGSPLSSPSSSAGKSKRRLSAGQDGPQPEYASLDIAKSCPKLVELLDKDPDEYELSKSDLDCLQFELETISRCASDLQVRAQGDITYLSTGDYPVEDLSTRLMPSYRLKDDVVPAPPRVPPQPSDNICGLPIDVIDDNLDIWPPSHIPTRFWTWCHHEWMKPLDIEFLKEFKQHIMDRYSKDSIKELYINEPWKYRGKKNGRRPINSPRESSPPAKRRRSSIVEARDEREAKKGMRDRIPSVISNVVEVVCREMKKEEPCDGAISPITSRRFSERLQIRDEKGDDLSIHTNGYDMNATRSPPLSPRLLNDVKEENGTDSSNEASMDFTPRRKSLKNGLPDDYKEIREDDSNDGIGEEVQAYKAVGERLLTHLIEKGMVPEYATNVLGHMTNPEVDVQVSSEGRDLCEDKTMDEVSDELLRAQQEFKDLEPDLMGILEHCWRKVRSDFAYSETCGQLDDADYDLFRLGVNLYRDAPRRTPTRGEWPTLRSGLLLRNRKARKHYVSYKRPPPFYRYQVSGPK